MTRGLVKVLSLVLTVITTPLVAAESVEDPETGALRRIEVAGRLALAGEELRRDTCVHGITSEGFLTILQHAENLDYYVWALRNGSLEEGLLPLTHPKVLKKIDAAEPLIAEASLFFSADHSILLEQVAKKTGSISKALDTQARFSVPDPTMAKLATLAARQAQDLAGIGADLCEGLRLNDMEGNLSAIKKKLFRFTMTSAALAHGNTEKQIAAPPNGQIQTLMAQADAQWVDILPILERAVEQGGFPHIQYKKIQTAITEMLTNYDFALYLYGAL